MPIVCIVGDESVARSLQLTRGVHAILVRRSELSGNSAHNVPHLKMLSMRFIKEWGLAKEGDRVVILHGHGADMTEGTAVTIAKVF